MTNRPENPSKSASLFGVAQKLLPGGVSRNTVYREPNPDYIASAQGCRVTDLDGKTRLDFANNMGSLIHGHATPEIISAVTQQLQKGTAVTLATEPELNLAEHICQRVSWFEKIRFMNSGTEAVMAAIKAARAITGRPGVAKAEGTYHGTYDYAEISQNAEPENWGPLDAPNPVPVAEGTPPNVLSDVVVFPFNDLKRTLNLLDQNSEKIACILVDLVPQRAGLITACPDYIFALREWATQHAVLLIFDEVITFRMELAGAAQWYDVEPDLTTLGKIIGGGFPIGALAGRHDVMSVLDPSHQDFKFPWSGTFSANPVTMTAGRVAMAMYDQASVSQINALGDYARESLNALIDELNVSASVTGAGSMFRIHPKSIRPTDYRSTWQNKQEQQKTKALVDHLYHQGFMTFRTCTAALSTVMTKAEIDQFVTATRTGMSTLWQ